jgi:hypothetical protein
MVALALLVHGVLISCPDHAYVAAAAHERPRSMGAAAGCSWSRGVDRAALKIGPQDLPTARGGRYHDQSSAQMARAVVRVDDRQTGAAARLDCSPCWSRTAHATDQGTICWFRSPWALSRAHG